MQESKFGIKRILDSLNEFISSIEEGKYVIGLIWWGSSLTNPKNAHDIDLLFILDETTTNMIADRIKAKVESFLSQNYSGLTFDLSYKDYYWFRGIKHPAMIGMAFEGYEIIRDTTGKIQKILNVLEEMVRKRPVKRKFLKGMKKDKNSNRWTYVYADVE